MWGNKFKYVPKFCTGATCHVISRMRNDDVHWSGTLDPNISITTGYALGHNGTPIGNGCWGIEWSHDR